MACNRLGQHRASFRKKNIDGRALLALQQGDLAKLGVKDMNAQAHIMLSIQLMPDQYVEPDKAGFSVLAWTSKEVTAVMHACVYYDMGGGQQCVCIFIGGAVTHILPWCLP